MYPDDIVDWVEPSAFDDVKEGFHKDALSKLKPEKLMSMLKFLGAKSLNDACKNIKSLNKEQYIMYLSKFEEEE